MATWKFTPVAALGILMFAGSAVAQSTTGSPAAGTETKTEQPKATDGKKSGAMRESRKGSMAVGNERVKAAQQALKDKGHDPGTVDGKLGRKTQAAIRDFQKAQGITTTGRLDSKTTQALGMEAGKTSTTGPSATGGSASPAEKK